MTDEAPSVKPRRILDRTASIARREEELVHALVVNLIGGQEHGTMDLVRSTIASRFEIEEDMLILRPLGSASFLLILPTGALFERVYNGGRPIITTTARLHIMRWTRLHRSSAASLHVAVEVEIRGIPPHAWELSTAELLLDEYCGIAAVHPRTEDRRDVF